MCSFVQKKLIDPKNAPKKCSRVAGAFRLLGPGEAPAAPPGAPVPLPHPRAPLGRAGEAPGPLAGPWGRIIVGMGHEELSRIWSFKGRYDCAVVVKRPKGCP